MVGPDVVPHDARRLARAAALGARAMNSELFAHDATSGAQPSTVAAVTPGTAATLRASAR